jgi:protein-histidine pros-kinase
MSHIDGTRDERERPPAGGLEPAAVQIVESAPDAFVIVDDRGSIVLLNAQAEGLFGYTRAELIGSNIEVLVPERYRDAHLAHRIGFIEDPHTRPMGIDLDLFALRKDGSEFPVEIGLSSLQTKSGSLVMAAVCDMTGRRRSEQLFRGLLDRRHRGSHNSAQRSERADVWLQPE